MILPLCMSPASIRRYCVETMVRQLAKLLRNVRFVPLVPDARCISMVETRDVSPSARDDVFVSVTLPRPRTHLCPPATVAITSIPRHFRDQWKHTC